MRPRCSKVSKKMLVGINIFAYLVDSKLFINHAEGDITSRPSVYAAFRALGCFWRLTGDSKLLCVARLMLAYLVGDRPLISALEQAHQYLSPNGMKLPKTLSLCPSTELWSNPSERASACDWSCWHQPRRTSPLMRKHKRLLRTEPQRSTHLWHVLCRLGRGLR
jgi:hypothetical protein